MTYETANVILTTGGHFDPLLTQRLHYHRLTTVRQKKDNIKKGLLKNFIQNSQVFLSLS